MRARLIAAAAVCLASCAASTGVISTGADTYSIANRDNGPLSSLGEIKAKAYQDAGSFCATKGKALEVIRSNDVPRSLGQFPEVELQFRCVRPL